ncbi:RimK family protein [Thiobacter aerophilum]|uniref:RimK family protein n=1 Tax=Thiobacter aerophilum TaxID=3121275 RepID=A0ABV0EII4_9BURK
MRSLIVVDDPRLWPLALPGVSVLAAHRYLTDPASAGKGPVQVFNLCQSYRYQSFGYYVSLLAEARGHRPLPRVSTLEDLHSPALVRLLTEEVQALIERVLARLEGDRFALPIYFGRHPLRRYAPLAHRLFALMPAPLLSADFMRRKGQWHLIRLRPMAAADVPSAHREFLLKALRDYFAGRGHVHRRPAPRLNLAILHDPANPEPPSNARAMEKFQRAARQLRIHPSFITREDFHRISEFDALFIRDTTYANHYTYRFARAAAAEGLVVIDDPDSILRCNNKVFLAELLARHRIPMPRTLVVHRNNAQRIVTELGLPCVLKQPDSSFSRGVLKIASEAELARTLPALFAESDLVIAQEWLPTTFDWRVGILDGRVLFVAQYVFPQGHWQVILRDAQRRKLVEGPTRAVPVEATPAAVVRLALRAANLIGDGFYGVDLKQVGNRVVVIEVNDNPNVDAGNEDGVVGDALYRQLMEVFLARVTARLCTA